MAEFVTVASVQDFNEGTVKACTVNGEMIAIVACNGQFYAINNICSHEYAELHEGEVDTDECTIECPLHGSQFSLESGRPRTLPAVTPIATYEVRVVGDEIQVAVS
ncbi:MAG TPA: non-heme iron oxygenase ferredoxin subunit [Herpetosiphonaceae bacterium]